MWKWSFFFSESQLPKCDLGPDWVVWPLQMAPAIIMHQGNLFWFWAVIWVTYGFSCRCFQRTGWEFWWTWFGFPVAEAGCGGLLGSMARGLKVENPCFGIIILVLTEVARLVVIATDINYPPDFPSGFSEYNTVKCRKPLFQCASIKSRWVFALITPWGLIFKIPSFKL